MKKKVALVLTVILLAGTNAAFAELSKGIQWVRSHEFPIAAHSEMSQGNIESISKYYGCGTTFYMRNAAGLGVTQSLQASVYMNKPWQVFAGMADAAWFTANVNLLMNTYPGCQGWHVGDEGCSTASERAERRALLDLVRGLVGNDPNVLVYTGFYGPDAGPMTSSEFASYIHNGVVDVAPDVLLTSCYPFYNNSIAVNYFDQLRIVREEALAAGIPYWMWAQSFGFTPLLNSLNEPSESDMRFQAFTALAYGHTGILYWSYDSNYDPYTQCLINVNGEPTHMYDSLQGISNEIKRYGNTIAHLTSTSVGWIQGGKTAPTGISNWSPGSGGDSHITNISVNSSGTEKNGVIGIFSDDLGGRYFMLVNAHRAYDADSAATAAEFTITFDSSVNSILTIDRSTGWLKRIVLSNHAYTFTLPGGTGDLFKYDDGKGFPGQFGYWDIVNMPVGDLDGDYDVDMNDLLFIVSNWLDINDPLVP